MATAGPPNVESMVIDAGPAGLSPSAVNTAYISVTVCVPGTTTCQTIDHVEIDTGSVGLRLLSSVLTVALPGEMDSSGNPLAECLMFADNTEAYGAVGVADMTLPVSGETAASVNVQLIGAASAGNPPAACTGTANNTVDSFGANGILGVGPVMTDCNPTGNCTPGASASYYGCPTPTTCAAEASVSVVQQVPNPVSLFATDNNGVIVELPSISADGAASPGPAVIVFGIGTESNNGLGSAVPLVADPDTGEISATLNGTSLSSYMDSGSNANFFADSSLATCGPSANSTFYCPTTTVTEDATLTSFDGSNPTVGNFNVADAATLFANTTFTAFDDLGAPAFTGSTTDLDLGLPFFFGHNIYLAIESSTANTPYFAIASN